MLTKLYGNDRCEYTARVKELLDEKGVRYNFLNTDNMENAKEMVNLTGQMGVPVVTFQGRIIVGWNKMAIFKLYESK